MRNRKTKMIVEMAIAIALAVVLGKIGIPMPQGGTVSLEMLPLLFIAFRWGFGAAFLAGAGEGLLQLLVGGYIVHPVQLILDYPLPFALVGLAGLFKTQMDKQGAPVKIILGSLLGAFARFICHVVSGVVFFGEYAPKGQNVWAYSTIYNGSFMIPSVVACIIILIAIRKQLANITPEQAITSNKIP